MFPWNKREIPTYKQINKHKIKKPYVVLCEITKKYLRYEITLGLSIKSYKQKYKLIFSIKYIKNVKTLQFMQYKEVQQKNYKLYPQIIIKIILKE